MPLVKDVLLEDGAWSREAWCAPDHFEPLLSLLVRWGGAEYLDDLPEIITATFDTFGAAHKIDISPQQARRLVAAVSGRLETTNDTERRKPLEGLQTLFEKLSGGNASNGWISVPQGTPVRNVRILRAVPDAAPTIWGRVRGILSRLGLNRRR